MADDLFAFEEDDAKDILAMLADWRGTRLKTLAPQPRAPATAAIPEYLAKSTGTITALSTATVTETGSTTSGGFEIQSLSGTSTLFVGMSATGSGIPTGAVIVSVDSSSQVTLSLAATASASVSIVFSGDVFGSGPIEIYGLVEGSDGNYRALDQGLPDTGYNDGAEIASGDYLICARDPYSGCLMVASSSSGATYFSVRGSSGGTAYAFAPNTTLQIGTSGETYTLAQSGTTVTIPDATATTGGVVSTVAQTYAGTKEFTDGISIPSGQTVAWLSGGSGYDTFIGLNLSSFFDPTGDVNTLGLTAGDTGVGTAFLISPTHGYALLYNWSTIAPAFAIRNYAGPTYVGDYYTDSIGNIFKGGLHIGTTSGGGGGGTGSGSGGGGTIARVSLGTGSGSVTTGTPAVATISGVKVPAGTILLVPVGLAYVTASGGLGSISVTFGGVALTASVPGTIESSGIFSLASFVYTFVAPSTTTANIVVTVNAAATMTAVVLASALYVTGLVANAVDKTANNTGAASTPDSGTTATTTVAQEYCEAAFMLLAASAGTWGSSFTSGGQDVSGTLSGSTFVLSEGYRVLSTTSTAHATMTGTTTAWSGCVGTFD